MSDHDRKQIPGLPELDRDEVNADEDFRVIQDTSSGSAKRSPAGSAGGRNVGTSADHSSPGGVDKVPTLARMASATGRAYSRAVGSESEHESPEGVDKVPTLARMTSATERAYSRTVGKDADQIPANSDLILTEDLTVQIPTDYATLQDAIDDLSRFRVKQGVVITLMVESGHQPVSGVSVSNGDYGHFVIDYQGDTLTLTDSFEGDFIHATRSVAPILSATVDMAGFGGSGYVLARKSTGEVSAGAGCLNAGVHGFEARSSVADITQSQWNGAADTGVRVQQASVVRGNSTSAKNCGSRAYYVSRASVLNGQDSDGSGSLSGAVIRRSFANLNGSLFDNCVEHGVWAVEGAWVNGSHSQANNATERAYRASTGSHLNIRNAQANDHGFSSGISCATGSTIVAIDVENDGNGGFDESKLNLTPNTMNSDGQIYVGGADDAVARSEIVSQGGDDEEGYWVRADGWAKAWATVTVDQTVEDGDVIVESPLQGFSVGYAEKSLRGGGAAAARRIRADAATGITYLAGASPESWRLAWSGTHDDDDNTYHLIVEGYLD